MTEKARRPNGAGSIEVRADGRARIRMIVAGKRKQIGPWHPTEERAQELLDAHNATAADGDVHAPGQVTFGQLGEEWLDRREISGRVRGIDAERDRWSAHVASAPFYGEPIDAIARPEVVDWIDELLATQAVQSIRGPEGTTIRRETGRTLSRETVAQCLRLVRGTFAYALEREVLEQSPITDVRVPAQVRDEDLDDAWTFLDEPEIGSVITSGHTQEVRRLAYTIAIFTGLRRGELVALRWVDVHEKDVMRPRIRVARGHKGPTKSKKIRTVPLFAPAASAFARLRELAAADAVLVFSNADGAMFGAGYDFGWRDKIERRGPKGEDGRHTLRTLAGGKALAGISRPVRFHDLRHTCASHLVMGTWGRAWTLEEVCAVMGHSSITVTQRYAHLAPDALHKAARTTGTNVIALPHAAPGRDVAIDGIDLENGLGRRGDRTPDQRRVKARSRVAVPQGSGVPGQSWGSVVEAAWEVIARVATGTSPGRAGEALVEMVLDDDAVRLALEIRRGGEFTTRRLIELAALFTNSDARPLAASD